MNVTSENILTPHQSAALNYRNHISLTANAGSGKTFVLSKRYLEIALNEDIRLRSIAAITFTDKAAGELYRKISKEIEKRLASNPDEKTKNKLEDIRRQLVSANISTIHAFCIDILREYPVEASLDANFYPIDEPLSNELVELSVDETIKSAFDNPEDAEDIKYLVRLFASRKILADELFSLIKGRKNIFDIADSIYNRTEEEIAQHFYSHFLKLVNEIHFSKKEQLFKSLCRINNEVLNHNNKNKLALDASPLIEGLSGNISVERFLKIVDELRNTILTQKCTIKISGYLVRDLHINLYDEIEFVEKSFKELISLSIPPNHSEIEKELAHFGKKLLKFFNKAVELYEEKKREKSYLDFEDILLRTRMILKNESVKKALSEKYKYIMVDEYQDTNEIQYQIFLPILNDLKAGNFFVVGDEKQSIYMFRDAELEVFSETKKNISETSGEKYLLTLPDSFRMAPEICLFTNSVFQKIFEDPNPVFNEVEYTELICARDESIKGEVEILIGDEDDNSPNSEQELVAKRILKLVSEKKIKWDDIAVLVRKRKNFSPLEKVFSKYKIPFSVIGGTGFYQKQMVYDIYNYFSFLLDKNNDTALVGILRSPFFNLSDAQIFEISREDGFRMWRKFKTYIEKNPSLQKVYDIIDENIVLVKSYEPAILLRKILDETSYLAILASKINGTQELANIEKLIGLTTSFNQQPFRTVYDYLNYLKESIEKAEDESQASVVEESDSVNIMTLHQAKGLEYKAVFLFKCDEIPIIDTINSKSIVAVKRAGILTKVPLNENYFEKYLEAPIVNIYNHIIKKKEIAEIKRLLYVGVTRAMDYLFISAKFKKDFKYSNASFIGILTEALNLNPETENINISSNLKFLKRKNLEYITESKIMSLNIPVIKEIEEIADVPGLNSDITLPEKIKADGIEDYPEGEIISATKLSIFSQCPVKYQLTYEYGFTNLMEKFRDWKYSLNFKKDNFSSSEENIEEDEHPAKTMSDIKGRIIHKILQEEVDKEDLKDAVDDLIKDEVEDTESDLQAFKDDIVSDLNKFYDSDSFSEISKFYDYKSEFEIYTKEDNYFLFGIIDRIAFKDNKAIIIDFKTDDIKSEEIQERFNSYLTQLKFYSYIVSRLLKNIEEFELRIIFIKHPQADCRISIKLNELSDIKECIDEMVSKTRKGNYEKNLEHCPKCIFSLNHNKCFVN